MAKRLLLDAKLDSSAADGLRKTLSAATGQDLLFDASKVELLGGLCLELLMSAHHLWQQAGQTFFVEAPSPQFVENLGRFGVSADQLSVGGEA